MQARKYARVLAGISFMLKLVRNLKREERKNAVIVGCALGVTVFSYA